MMKKTLTMALLAACALSASRAVANTITVGNSGVAPAGPNFKWTYTASVANGIVDSGSGLITIYDFAGYIPGSEFDPGADWAFSSAGTGITPADLAPVGAIFDDPAIPNLSWSYVGAAPIVSPSVAVSVPLGLFGADSIYGTPVADKYVTRDKNIPPPPSAASGSFGTVAVPEIRIITIPDGGSSIVLLGLGLLGFGAFRRRTA